MATPRVPLLGLARPYLLAIPLTFALVLIRGETGIWIAGPLAEVLTGVLTVMVLRQHGGGLGLRRGLFTAPAGPRNA